MGIITDAFGKLFKVIWDVILWIYDGIRNIIQTVIDVIVGFFQVIFDLIEGILYFLYMIGVLAVKLFTLLFEVGKVLWSLVVGFGRTLASLSYSPRGSGGNGYSSTIGKLFDKLEPLQIAPIAYILLFILWYITAISAMKLISSIRVGGS
ncbi:hypothetical protein [Virgibacillus sp. SK37]|uniref:hypothetical protein n=1 Tax=Virgibacillus sp. SK37 TaxID=403957 RepID=UPI0004D19738|nr:hypothetical protein [Virgibacillus sp. SK37]AIF45729.1 hypothetical protein X953_19835 [Virgibacillus sp. SK37]